MPVDLTFFKKSAIMLDMEYFTGYFDGSCAPVNPNGTAAYGFVLYRNGVLVDSGRGVIGSGAGFTNNVAEHHAFGQLLKAFMRQGVSNTVLTVRGDSQLVIYQMNGKWAIKGGAYKPEALKNLQRLKDIRKMSVAVYVEWIPREKNQICDKLSKNVEHPLTN